MRRPRLLVTGFSAFPGARVNPTALLAAGLDVDRLARRFDIELATAVLPTEYAAVKELLPRMWAELGPSAAIHLGLHGRAATVRIETRAKNHMSPVRPDAARARPDRSEIDPSGPAIRRSTLPVVPILAAMRRRGVPARLSHNAGSYLCNFASYLSLTLAGPGAIAGFIHLPWPAETQAPRAPAERPGWAVLEAAVEEAIRSAAVAARRGTPRS